VRSPRVWELARRWRYAERPEKSSPKLDLKVEMRALCSIFVEIESTNDKYKYEYRCKCHVSCSCCGRKTSSSKPDAVWRPVSVVAV
jgi:hypothetical protein